MRRRHHRNLTRYQKPLNPRIRFQQHRPIRYPWVWINILTILLGTIITLFVLGYLNPLNPIMNLGRWALVIAYAFFVIRATWFLLKRINRVRLMSDLSLWMLRIVSVLLIVGILFIGFFGSILVIFSRDGLQFFIFCVGCFCVFVIGAFGLFRFRRRHTIVGVWH